MAYTMCLRRLNLVSLAPPLLNNNNNILLSKIDLPAGVIQCKNSKCDETIHLEMIDKFYQETAKFLLVASSGLLQTKRKKSKFKVVPGWNNTVKDAHAAASRAYMKWLSNNRPRCGPSYIDMKETRKSFKYCLKQCKKNEEQLRADSITNSLKKISPSRFGA